MNLTSFVATVVLVTASGALAPGPLFFATIARGTRFGAKSGLLFSIAHTLVEFTFIMLLAYGLLTVIHKPVARLVVGVAGGVVLLVFGTIQIRDSLQPKFHEVKIEQAGTRSLLLTGAALTGLNPFFIVWWLTTGSNLIFLSLEFASFAGVVFMYVCHVWMDYVWLTSIAHLARIGTNVVGLRWYRGIMVVFGAVLIYFGVTFLINSIA
jgi:threonine/homoserine/homoserine lactone efflux protein